jgi:hypothetical protein
MNTAKLAKKIAREIFKCGNERDFVCQRIQFKCGRWPQETSGGGLNEEALEQLIRRVLKENP